jgi:hypothetical protein
MIQYRLVGELRQKQGDVNIERLAAVPRVAKPTRYQVNR